MSKESRSYGPLESFSGKHLLPNAEKTGGTSTLAALLTLYGRNQVLLYSRREDLFIRQSDVSLTTTHPLVELIKRYSRSLPPLYPLFAQIYEQFATPQRQANGYYPHQLPANFSALTGHFEPDQVPTQVNNVLLTAMVRDPLARMWSHFINWRAKKGQVNWRAQIPWDPALTFEKFAFLEELRNFQYRAICGNRFSPEDFAVIGNTENLQAYFNLLCVVVRTEFPHLLPANAPLNPPLVPTLNKSLCSPEMPAINRKKFRRFHELDYELLDRVTPFNYSGQFTTSAYLPTLSSK